MMNVKLTQALYLMLIVAFTVSVGEGQDKGLAPKGANDSSGPAAPGSSSTPPAEPLKVVCKGNQLAVTANDATLGSILNEVQKCTGAKMDVPPGAAEIRFFDTIGPLPVKEVLSDLLTASGYDFVIQASESDPGKVQAVSLMARAASPADTPSDRPLTPTRRIFQKMRKDALTEAGIATDDNSSPPEENTIAPTVVQPATAGAEGAANSAEAPTNNATASSDANQASAPSPTATPQENTVPSSPAPDRASTPGEPKTVDDQITNMQQMFEQRRQMMQNPPSPPQR